MTVERVIHLIGHLEGLRVNLALIDGSRLDDCELVSAGHGHPTLWLFVNGSDRMAHLKELEAELSVRFREQTRAHWLAALDEKGVPCGPVHDMLEALDDPQTLARDMVVEVEHSTLGPVKTIGLPVKFSATPGKVRSGAPVYGEHTREVLREHGFDQAQIDAFEREGAVVAASTGRKEQVA